MNDLQDVSLLRPSVGRRDFLRLVTSSLAVASAASVPLDQAAAAPAPANDKRKARYQATSEEVRNFYRVNRYPGQ
jgi:hypothetical protein